MRCLLTVSSRPFPSPIYPSHIVYIRDVSASIEWAMLPKIMGQ